MRGKEMINSWKLMNMCPYNTMFCGRTFESWASRTCRDIRAQPVVQSGIYYPIFYDNLLHMFSEFNMKFEQELMILCITPKHLNRIEFAMEFRQKHAYMPPALNIMLEHWLLHGEITLQWQNLVHVRGHQSISLPYLLYSLPLTPTPPCAYVHPLLPLYQYQ
jgi:hypothetical protein